MTFRPFDGGGFKIRADGTFVEVITEEGLLGRASSAAAPSAASNEAEIREATVRIQDTMTVASAWMDLMMKGDVEEFESSLVIKIEEFLVRGATTLSRVSATAGGFVDLATAAAIAEVEYSELRKEVKASLGDITQHSVMKRKLTLLTSGEKSDKNPKIESQGPADALPIEDSQAPCDEHDLQDSQAPWDEDDL